MPNSKNSIPPTQASKKQSSAHNVFEVDAAEAGQKLLQYLLRKSALPQPLLHRWIRTGQIRINGGRAKPFMHIKEHDSIRLPPFALSMINSIASDKHLPQEERLEHIHTQKMFQQQPTPTLPLPERIFTNEHLFVFNKEAGLPIHTGTGHEDSLATRLEKHFACEKFKPTPAHRLDKDTSGIVLVARSYKALRALQDAFASRHMSKEYLAWVHGIWPHMHIERLHHHMGRSYQGYDEKVRILSADQGKESISIVQCVQQSHNASLMHIRLITGRKHQIRVQMAAKGHPLIGDGKYGKNTPLNTSLCLHALRITLPTSPIFASLGLEGASFTVLPTWKGWQKVDAAPIILTEVP